ncbi:MULTISPECIES: 2-succinyl-5-enolpyruvyl-6-hydroxy-3-cyclohexene-1-carboxylic-acid synthase [Virgibacillus]|uniref:2-succinyl-5-enolpyruvyl-6-hydroxy-3-cyclohexene-1-carboxylate synthase n=2 Tax=Virgibacillus TaxID=84406 RepID=A0A024QAI1_9BACI|nr:MULTISPECIES: 2-succinyl-5-enolpyruvyl-6-hydroxy-3-cyclohexene-1-carboxylic-acid synthase [Virgibacillus]EQB37261.1 hypothetical protein M948_01630 [Virgibacillus sp. CM-4]MYL40018.1 2-succinyl-5-enolpyruvyl-6-hydroxy-3-cyclohexene-1-carboxylic-acid synthase [Virgibacillus massiliensis]GGJ62826.1 2-succinyl-5-enolpyruvyl-6-hydroxy-3-cyclohexene-1-carboxylate synthase [Virgibacillus kapii]CDQ39240.1 2-succinyl-5-enolpyruvyl-6-hydroxy-3-cyclohexene-1-carboxylate synthase [Virgibacillus massili
MNHTEVLTRYTANFVDELAMNGLTDAVISPGSRSTPLALTIAEHESIKEWVIIDERSAAFFALGMAKKTKRPVALICTSGTAAANYYPAIVEAYYSRVPLIVLTADRPHELRDVGAPQAIEQIKLYGDYVKWFQEMALPEAAPDMLKYARSKAARAFFMAKEGNPGAVHLNFPFREPLVVDFELDHLWGKVSQTSYLPTFEGEKHLTSNQLTELSQLLQNKAKGLIVCGPQTDRYLAKAVTKLASKWELPIIADPLSQLRSGEHKKQHIIDGYDAFLRNETIREELKPDFIIRIGAMPVSKAYLFFVKQHMDALQIVIENERGFREPTGNKTEFIFANARAVCEALTEVDNHTQYRKEWLRKWQQMNAISKKHFSRHTENPITEGEAMRGLIHAIPNHSSIFVGNSMAVRDLDTFFLTTEKHIEVLANRGANGIDGMISSGMGAAVHGSRLTLVLGDLSFFHDMNGLHAAMHYGISATVLLMNNNGGGIFSFLPQANDKRHFEALFGTPLNIDFQHVIAMYGGHYDRPQSEEEVKMAVQASYQRNGLSVIEVKTDREANAIWHRDKWKAIEEEIVSGEE